MKLGGPDVDKMWEQMLFALIGKCFLAVSQCACVGEQFEETQVVGAGLCIRQRERLMQVWLKDGRDEKLRANVSNKIRHFLGLDPAAVTLYYKQHCKSIQDGSTMRNAEGFKFRPLMQKKPWSYQNPPTATKAHFHDKFSVDHPRQLAAHRHQSFEYA